MTKKLISTIVAIAFLLETAVPAGAYPISVRQGALRPMAEALRGKDDTGAGSKPVLDKSSPAGEAPAFNEEDMVSQTEFSMDAANANYISDLPPEVIRIIDSFKSFDEFEKWFKGEFSQLNTAGRPSTEMLIALEKLALLFGFESNPEDGLGASLGSIAGNMEVGDRDKELIYNEFYSYKMYKPIPSMPWEPDTMWETVSGELYKMLNGVIDSAYPAKISWRIKQYKSLILKLRNMHVRLSGAAKDAPPQDAAGLIEKLMGFKNVIVAGPAEYLDDMLGLYFIIDDAGMDIEGRERALFIYSDKIMHALPRFNVRAEVIRKESRVPGFEAVNIYVYGLLDHRHFGSLPIKIQVRFKKALFQEMAMRYCYKTYASFRLPPWAQDIDFSALADTKQVQKALFEGFKSYINKEAGQSSLESPKSSSAGEEAEQAFDEAITDIACLLCNLPADNPSVYQVLDLISYTSFDKETALQLQEKLEEQCPLLTGMRKHYPGDFIGYDIAPNVPHYVRTHLRYEVFDWLINNNHAALGHQVTIDDLTLTLRDVIELWLTFYPKPLEIVDKLKEAEDKIRVARQPASTPGQVQDGKRAFAELRKIISVLDHTDSQMIKLYSRGNHLIGDALRSARNIAATRASSERPAQPAKAADAARMARLDKRELERRKDFSRMKREFAREKEAFRSKGGQAGKSSSDGEGSAMGNEKPHEVSIGGMSIEIGQKYLHENGGIVTILGYDPVQDAVKLSGRKQDVYVQTNASSIKFCKLNSPEGTALLKERAINQYPEAEEFLPLILGYRELVSIIKNDGPLKKVCGDILNRLLTDYGFSDDYDLAHFLASGRKRYRGDLESLTSLAREIILTVFEETGIDLVQRGVHNSEILEGGKWPYVAKICNKGVVLEAITIPCYMNSHRSKTGKNKVSQESELYFRKYCHMLAGKGVNVLLEQADEGAEAEYSRYGHKGCLSVAAYYPVTDPAHNDDRFSNAILRMKNSPEVAHEIVERYAEKIRSILKPDKIDIIVPVPAYVDEQNQVIPLANALGELLSLPVARGAIIKTRQNKKQKDQKTLSGRRSNVRDIFKAVPEEIKGKRVLIVDDVVTTGATLANAKSAARKAGAQSVATFAFGYTERSNLHKAGQDLNMINSSMQLIDSAA